MVPICKSVFSKSAVFSHYTHCYTECNGMGVTRYTHHYTPPLHSPLHTFALHPPLHPQWVCYRGCNSLHYTTSVTLSVTLCVTWLCSPSTCACCRASSLVSGGAAAARSAASCPSGPARTEGRQLLRRHSLSSPPERACPTRTDGRQLRRRHSLFMSKS